MDNSVIKTDIKPKSNSFKTSVVKIGFWALGRTIQSLSRFDKETKAEIEHWNEGFSFILKVLPNNACLSMVKQNGKLKFKGLKELQNPELTVYLKNIDTAFRMITAQWGVHHVYAQHKTSVIGNVVDAMILIRLIYKAEDYLFPPILSKNILKSLLKASFGKFFTRLRLYTLGLLFGI